MAVNNDFCSNFWTPRYYKDLELLLSVYKFNGSSAIHKKLIGEIKFKYSIVQKYARYRGFLLLCLCIAYLVFMGFETQEDIKNIEKYLSIIYFTIFIAITILLPGVFLHTWRGVLMSLFFCCLLAFILPNYIDVTNYPVITESVYKYKSIILVIVLISPIMYQLYIYWLYSSVYKGFLKTHISKEYNKFKKSMEGIKNSDRTIVDTVYLEVWTDEKWNNTGQDATLTPYYNKLSEQLLNVASPTHSKLLFSWLKHHFSKLFRIKLKAEPIDSNIHESTKDMLSQYEANKKGTLDFTKEYLQYCEWKKTAGKNNSIKTFCSKKGISAKDMIAWLRVTKPNKQ